MNFSPYQPPPDAEDRPLAPAPKGKAKTKPWFARDGSSASGYQSGAGAESPVGAAQAFGNDPEAAIGYNGGGGGYTGASSSSAGPSSGYGYPSASNEERVNAWESRFGWRIDVMSAAAYLGGPVTALIFLILETQNDYVRFHAYQSALLTTPLVLFMLLTTLLIPLWTWLRTLIILGGVGAALYAAYRAYTDAQEGLGRYWVPYIGEVAERWVNEE